MASITGSALAETEVRDPATGELCPEVEPAIGPANHGWLSTSLAYESGGCTVRMTGTHDYHSKMNYSTSVKRCTVSYTLHVGPDGWGYADDVDFYNTPGYYNCPISTTQSCAGARLVSPGDYQPATSPYSTVWPLTYPAADGDTGLNVEMCGRITYPSNENVWGGLSLEVLDSDPFTLSNQYAGTPEGFHRFSGGRWYELNGQSLEITRN
jgi:hypothetical protein